MSDDVIRDNNKEEVADLRPAWRPQDADREYYRYETKKRIQHYTVPPQTIFRPAKPTPTIRDGDPKRVAVYARVSTKSKEQVARRLCGTSQNVLLDDQEAFSKHLGQQNGVQHVCDPSV